MNNTNERSAKRWWALLALSLGVFMGLLDVNIVNVALPTMVKSFHTTFSNVQWVISAYTISYAVVILVLSKLADMYGRKKMFLTCMIIFVVASGVNGLAPNLFGYRLCCAGLGWWRIDDHLNDFDCLYF